MQRWYLLITEKFMFWTFRRREIRSVFRAEKLMERLYLLITDRFLFWTFWWWKIRSFWSQKTDGKIIFTDYWQVLVLNFLVMENTVFLEPKNWWKDYIYWFLKSSCFEIFGNGKYRLFFSKDVAGKMIFTWSFWAFHDIPILDKYGFSSSLKHLFKRKTLLSVTLLIKKTLRKLVIILSLHCNRLPNKIRNEMEKPTIYFRLLSFTKIWICMIVKW